MPAEGWFHPSDRNNSFPDREQRKKKKKILSGCLTLSRVAAQLQDVLGSVSQHGEGHCAAARGSCFTVAGCVHTLQCEHELKAVFVVACLVPEGA